MKIIQRFEKKLIRFEKEFQKLDDMNNSYDNGLNDDVFDLHNRQGENELLDNSDIIE
jgi:hypothetical protein